MHAIQSCRHYQARIKHHQTSADNQCFFNLLTCDSMLDKVEELLPEHRERLFPPTETLSLFLAQAMSEDRSCQRIVNQSSIQRAVFGSRPISTITGGYCRARQRLPLNMVNQLACYLGEQIHRDSPDQWRWMGRPVKLVDGTTLTMPDTSENQKSFPQQRGQQPGLGFPICRLVGITCLASGALLDAAIGRFNGKGGDEQTLLRSMEDQFKTGDILLGDAFFSTYFFIASMQIRGVDILMEQQGARRRKTDFRLGAKLAQRDHLITLTKPKIRPHWMTPADYDAAPNSLLIRECKVGGKIMVTTMTCAKTYPKAKLKSLYKQRWQVELDIRHIKDTLGMNILTCKSPAMVIKEIWVYLLAYNLIRYMMAQSALLSDLSPRKLSFKHCLQLWSIAVQQMVMSDDQQMRVLLSLMSEKQVGNRPRRIEPRAVKRRPKPFPLLLKPRDQAREEVRKSGHPKKLK
ncbi:IS4 family transposase [Gilvimarinus sp. SDUM040013]|uniref:IS4 family transposase n=1 Tax=Gilvimarinus gilvus TaxID=3058038 RepID=A0ABU4S373_9GAMM|nr:IS4 family transposase [Gilvimarinus sp. SDUM040013]MDO3385391.1 IS4 family transposase [Gilvimarinus sp. SDUM040013]MDX6851578.1 IS4 family transposase [Gilvimarinus sp. SDUM040013]